MQIRVATPPVGWIEPQPDQVQLGAIVVPSRDQLQCLRRLALGRRKQHNVETLCKAPANVPRLVGRERESGRYGDARTESSHNRRQPTCVWKLDSMYVCMYEDGGKRIRSSIS